MLALPVPYKKKQKRLIIRLQWYIDAKDKNTSKVLRDFLQVYKNKVRSFITIWLFSPGLLFVAIHHKRLLVLRSTFCAAK
jgi:hypothetical protein